MTSIMYFLSLLLTTILLGSVSFASPVQPNDAEPVTRWTTSGVARRRMANNQQCAWYMTISSSTTSSSSPPASAPSNGTTTTDDMNFYCDFFVQTPEGQDCGLKTFRDARCRNNPAFRISGGHSSQGFMVVVVQNVEEHLQAYFGYDDAALDAPAPIPPQTSVAEPLAGDTKRDLLDRQGGSGNGTVWMIRNLVRLVDTHTNAIHMTFAIDTGNKNPNTVPCSLHVAAPTGTNLKTWQWYDKKCNGSDFYVSWGYMAAPDAGILTLVNPTRDRAAFFGFTDVNKSEKLEPNKPSAVLPCDCNVKPAVA